MNASEAKETSLINSWNKISKFIRESIETSVNQGKLGIKYYIYSKVVYNRCLNDIKILKELGYECFIEECMKPHPDSELNDLGFTSDEFNYVVLTIKWS